MILIYIPLWLYYNYDGGYKGAGESNLHSTLVILQSGEYEKLDTDNVNLHSTLVILQFPTHLIQQIS